MAASGGPGRLSRSGSRAVRWKMPSLARFSQRVSDTERRKMGRRGELVTVVYEEQQKSSTGVLKREASLKSALQALAEEAPTMVEVPPSPPKEARVEILFHRGSSSRSRQGRD